MGKLMDRIKPGLRPLPPGTTFGDIRILLATWFGAGRIRPASGTMGSIAALPLGFGIEYFWGIPGLLFCTLVVFGLGVMAGDYYGKKSGEPDDSAIVIDEVVGMWIAGLPAEHSVPLWLVAFLLFRLFDIFKPWPASYFDKKKRGGWDVMMDDVVAGIYAFVGVAAAALQYVIRQ